MFKKNQHAYILRVLLSWGGGGGGGGGKLNICRLVLNYPLSAIPYLCRAKEAKRQRLHQQKRRYEDSMWNINTVTMGGLGGEPDMSSDEGETCSYFSFVAPK